MKYLVTWIVGIGVLIAGGCVKKEYHETYVVTCPSDSLTVPVVLGDLEVAVRLTPKSFGNQLWAAYLYMVPNAAEYFGDEFRETLTKDIFAFTLQSPRKGAVVELKARENELLEHADARVIMPDEGNPVEIRPVVAWKYDALRQLRLSKPITMSWDVTVDGQHVGIFEKVFQGMRVNETLNILLPDKPIAGVPLNENGALDVAEFYVGFVEEQNPLCDRLQTEAVEMGLIDIFSGYQLGEEAIKQQLWSIWYLMEKKGLTYGSAMQIPGNKTGQEIRLVDEAFEGKLSNCADGTILLASIFARMDFNVALAILPNHMYLVIADENGEPAYAIETAWLRLFDGNVYATEKERRQESKKNFEFLLEEMWNIHLEEFAPENMCFGKKLIWLNDVRPYIPSLNTWK